MKLEEASARPILVALTAACLAMGASAASAQEADGEPDAGRPVHGYVKIAGHVGWDLAGFGTVGILLGRSASHLQISARGMGGQPMDGSGTCLGIGGEVGYRGIWRVHRKIRLAAMIAPAYLFRRWKSSFTGNVFRYHIPMAALGFGVVFGEGVRRISHGVEISFDAGYAFQDPSSGGSSTRDYSGFYGSGGIGWAMMF